ncbi:hypothetical protein pb186bvf_013119 [Paramecium bursaria]
MQILPIRAIDDVQMSKCILTQRRDRSYTSRLLEQFQYQLNNNLCDCSQQKKFTVVCDNEYLKLYQHHISQELEIVECICTTSKLIVQRIKENIHSQYQCDKCQLYALKNPTQTIQTCNWCFFTKCMICHRSQELYHNICLCQQENQSKPQRFFFLNILKIFLQNLFVTLMVIPGYVGLKLQNVSQEIIIQKFGKYIGSFIYYIGLSLVVIITVLISIICYVPTYFIITFYDIWEQFKIQ